MNKIKALLKRLECRCETGTLLPPFYYGFSHYELYKEEWVFYVIPLNYIVRLWQAIIRLQNDKRLYQIAKSRVKECRRREKIEAVIAELRAMVDSLSDEE